MSAAYGRPRGSFGEIGRAMVNAAASGPAPVRVLAERAQVGYDAARYTASRLVRAGVLAVAAEGRPVVLAVPEHAPGAAPEPMEELAVAIRSFWER